MTYEEKLQRRDALRKVRLHVLAQAASTVSTGQMRRVIRLLADTELSIDGKPSQSTLELQRIWSVGT